MSGRAVAALLAASCLLVGPALSQTTTQSPDDSAVPKFRQYFLYEDFEFGKFKKDQLEPDTVLVHRQTSIAKLKISSVAFNVETVVGSDEPEIADGVGLEAKFDHIFDLAQITDQKLWIVSELTYNCLRAIDAVTLNVSTFSGTCSLQSSTSPYVGSVLETQWALPGLMAYSEAERKLYVSSNGGLRAINMATSRVEVVLEQISPLYDMSMMASGNLLLLHSSVIDELNPANATNPVTVWRKDNSDVLFSFVFDMTKVDEKRFFIADDMQGVWLLNLETGGLTQMCPESKIELVTGDQEPCYREPASVQHIAFINGYLFIMSYQSTSDITTSFELTAFLSYLPGSTNISAAENSTATGSLDTTVQGETTNATVPEGDDMANMTVTTEMVKEDNETANATIAESTTVSEVSGGVENVTAAVDDSTEFMNATESTMQNMTADGEPMETTEAMVTDVNITGSDNTTDNSTADMTTTFDYSTTESDYSSAMESESTTPELVYPSSTEAEPTKAPEEKTPATPDPNEKPGKSDTGASKDNAAGSHAASMAFCLSSLVAPLLLYRAY